MPVRSLNSVVFKWPKRDQVLSAARRWAVDLVRRDQCVRSVFCVGSCARGDWGVGSDLDAIVIIEDADLSLPERRARYEPCDMPVPVDVTVYTQTEWAQLEENHSLLWIRLQRESLDLVK